MIREILKKDLIPSDKYIFGTADLSGLIDRKFGDHHFGISIGKRLDDGILDTIADGPTMEYYQHYHRVNTELSAMASKIKNELNKNKIDSIIIEPTVSTSSKEFEKYLPSLTVDISHKMVATRAGLGWIGKTDLFISKQFGPRLRLVSLLINQNPGHSFRPIDKSRCGKCNICVDKCPAQAATGILWNIEIHRDLFFDAHKCRNKCGELAKQKLNVDKRICGLCVSVCPVGRQRNHSLTIPSLP